MGLVIVVHCQGVNVRLFFFENVVLLEIVNIDSGSLSDAVKIICLVDLNIFGVIPYSEDISKNSKEE